MALLLLLFLLFLSGAAGISGFAIVLFIFLFGFRAFMVN